MGGMALRMLTRKLNGQANVSLEDLNLKMNKKNKASELKDK